MIYLDNNATTQVHPEVLDVMHRVAGEAVGNPGSRHPAGRRARQILEDARESIAEILQATPAEVVFTSGGTESSNLAIHGLTAGRTGVVLLPGGEHPATEEPVRRLLAQGWQRQALSLDGQGRLIPEEVASISLEQVQLATCLLAHNETGVIHDLAPLAERCLEQEIPLHVDAVQSVGKIPFSFRQLQATTVSIAAHKFHGPGGIGALLVRRGTRLTPLMTGGHQEQGLRPGTEPVVLAAGMAAALRIWHADATAQTTRMTDLRDQLQLGLLDSCAPAVVNGVSAPRLPNTLNVAFPGCQGDALLLALDLTGVCCSLGSACASGSTEPSPVLLAMGLPAEVYQSSLRLSLSAQTTSAEITEAISRITATVRKLRAVQAECAG